MNGESRTPTPHAPWMADAVRLAEKVTQGYVFDNAAEVYDSLKTVSVALLASRSETSTSDAKDAARYRELRDSMSSEVVNGWRQWRFTAEDGIELEAAIDGQLERYKRFHPSPHPGRIVKENPDG